MWLAMIFFATGAKRQTPIANERVHAALAAIVGCARFALPA